MTAPEARERAYRRLLALYPNWFRQQREEEMIGVLMAGGQGERRPGLGESLDLVRGAAAMRLHPRTKLTRGVAKAMRLMYLGSLLQLLALLTSFLTLQSVRAAILARYPALTAAQWHDIVAVSVVPAWIEAPIMAALWAILALAVGRGVRWARVAFAVLFGIYALGLLGAIARGDVLYAPADIVADALQWLAGFLALGLIVRDATREETLQPPAGAVG